MGENERERSREIERPRVRERDIDERKRERENYTVGLILVPSGGATKTGLPTILDPCCMAGAMITEPATAVASSFSFSSLAFLSSSTCFLLAARLSFRFVIATSFSSLLRFMVEMLFASRAKSKDN